MRTFLRVWIGIGLIAIGFGIAIIIISMTSNVSSWRDIPTTSLNESYDNIQSLDFDIGYGKVIIEEGDTFSVDAQNVPDGGFKSYVTDGTWYIREDNNNIIDLFGWRFSMGQVFNWDEDYSPKITITIPQNFVAETYKLKVGAGEADVSNINAKEGDLNVGAGKLKIDELSINGTSKYEVGTGEMEIKNFTADDTKIKCGIGHISIDGTIMGDNNINCGIGSIELNLQGSEDDYSYDVNGGIGSVRIDGQNYHDYHRNNEVENNLNMDCGIGSITVEFH